MAAAVVGCASAVTAAAAAEQKDEDQNDPQATAVVTVVPHIAFTSLSKSKPYYVLTGQK